MPKYPCRLISGLITTTRLNPSLVVTRLASPVSGVWCPAVTAREMTPRDDGGCSGDRGANARPSRSLTIRTCYIILPLYLLICCFNCPTRAYHKLFCPSVPIPSTCYLIWAFVAPPLLPSFYSVVQSFMRTKSTLALMDGISQLVLYILHFHGNFSSLSTVNHLQFEPYPIDGSFLEQQIF